ncbi:MAG: hypothetical protein HY521_03640 [Proteobacteria bacterium]|nr:hypothetical protein [Pseudomonadota bacterium]
MRRPAGRLLALLLAVAALGWAAAGAQDRAEVVTRAWTHEGYGRIVFDWGTPVAHVATVTGTRLVVGFDRPFRTDLSPLVRNLGGYVTGAEAGPDGRTLTLSLTGSFGLRTFNNGMAVVVDLLGPAAAAPAAPSPPGGVQETRAPAGGELPVRTGAHAGFGRLVFDWSQAVDYRVSRDGEIVVVAFDRPAGVDLARLRGQLPAQVLSAEAVVDQNGLSLNLGVGPGARVRHFRSGTRIVLDVLDGSGAAAAGPPSPARARPAGTAAVRPAAGPATPAPVAPAKAAPAADATVPAAEEPRRSGRFSRTIAAPSGAGQAAPPAVSPRAPEAPTVAPAGSAPGAAPAATSPVAEAPRAPQVAAAEGAAPEGGRPRPLVPPREAAVPALTGAGAEAEERQPGAEPSRPEEPRIAPVGALAVAAKAEGSEVVLTFPWPGAVGAAAFRRAGQLWLLFDEEAQLDLAQVRAQPLLADTRQIPTPGATALRLTLPDGVNPRFRRDGRAWIATFTRIDVEPESTVEVEARQSRTLGTALIIRATGTSRVVRFGDPEVGDMLLAVPLQTPGLGVRMERVYPDLKLLATPQGVVIEPTADDLIVRTAQGGLTIARPGGLAATPDTRQLAQERALGEPSAVSRLFDFDAWARGGLEGFTANVKAIEAAIIASPRARRNSARLDLARLYFAHGFDAEALGILEVIARADEKAADDPGFRLMRGAANLLMGRIEEATPDLGHPSLARNTEAELWRAVLAAQRGDWRGAATLFRSGAALLPTYPPKLKSRLGSVAFEAALKTRDVRRAEQIFRILAREQQRGGDTTLVDTGQYEYLRGRLLEARGDFDGALAAWNSVERFGDRRARSQADLARLDLLMRIERIDRPTAIEAMEKLRFAWRGDDFEFDLLNRLADLYFEEKNYRDGLRTLKIAATYFPTHRDAQLVTLKMATAFNELYLAGLADTMPPITAIALYDEFRELTPAGEKGDEMIRRLADRLVSVDLLGKAAEVLDHQITYRLKGEQRSRVGARLALIHLLNKAPLEALKVLDETEIAGLPGELAGQRRHLRARALVEDGKLEEALAVLKGDESVDGLRLIAEIHWQRRDWRTAALALDNLVAAGVDASNGLDLAESRDVASLAVALALSDNERGLGRLKRRYAAEMLKTPFREAFALITRESDVTLANFKEVGEGIKLAESFQTFMGAYRERVRSGRLSAIN